MTHSFESHMTMMFPQTAEVPGELYVQGAFIGRGGPGHANRREGRRKWSRLDELTA